MDRSINDNALISSERILCQLLEQVWMLLLMVINLAALGSLARSFVLGWAPMYALPLALALVFNSSHLLRRRLSFDSRVSLVLAMFYIAGISALYVFNAVAAGIWWLVLCALLGKLFHPRQLGNMHAGICLLLICGAAYGFVAGHLSLPFDPAEYIRRPTSWIGIIIGCVVLSLLIFAAISTYQRAVLNLLREVADSRRELERSRHQLDALRKSETSCPHCHQPAQQ
jgi:hypothetical protein